MEKCRNKGFTIIELLAVVTILSIILLISFPAIINIIRNDREKQYNDLSNTLCKAGETYIYNNKELFPELNTSGEEFYVRVASLIEENLVNKIQTSPKTGKSINQNLLKYKVKPDKSLSCSYLERSLATLVSDTGTTGLSIGDKYTYEVYPGQKYNFYVLSVEDDKVNLIMDRNICNDGSITYTSVNNYCRYEWASNNVNKNGPVTAMTVLGNATRNWNNVPNMDLAYNDITDNTSSGYTESTTYGYTGMTITNGTGYITKKDGTQTTISITDNMPIKARLPKLKEITEAGCHTYSPNSDYGSCPMWLVKNLYYDTDFSSYCSACVSKYSNNQNNGITNIYGYWLLSSHPGDSYSARRVYYYGRVGNVSANDAVSSGVRAVITVPKSDFLD